MLTCTCVHACMRACLHACMRACLHACMRTCLHAYMSFYVHTCAQSQTPDQKQFTGRIQGVLWHRRQEIDPDLHFVHPGGLTLGAVTRTLKSKQHRTKGNICLLQRGECCQFFFRTFLGSISRLPCLSSPSWKPKVLGPYMYMEVYLYLYLYGSLSISML